MVYHYSPKGVCSQHFEIDVEDGIIQDVTIQGGCNGNLKGISSLIKGRKVEEVKELLKGITCGPRNTSCPDQLSKALEELS